MRIVLSNTRSLTARRVIQGGMTFAAFGALTMAASLPANADTVLHGSATATVAGYELYLLGTPQGEENSNSETFDEQVESYLAVDGDASNWVDAEGVHSSVTVNNAHAQLTWDDILGIIEDSDELATTEGDAEDLLGEESVETFDEEDGEIVLDVEFNNASVGVSKNWNGEYSTTFTPAEIVINHSDFDIEIDTVTVEGEEQLEDRYEDGVTWDAAYNHLFGTFTSGEFLLQFELAGTAAGTSDLVVDDGDDQNGGGGDDDDDNDTGGGDTGGGDDGKDDEDGKDDGKGDGGKGDDGDDSKKPQDDDLARTGSPIAALIAAGVAITAGGGAAAYFARRRKNSNEELTETDES